MTVDSWIDQRNYLDSALKLLQARDAGAVYQQLAQNITRSLDSIAALNLTQSNLVQEGYRPVQGLPDEQVQTMFTCGEWNLKFGMDLSLTMMNSSGFELEGNLGRFIYQTISPDDFTAFDKDYGNGGCTPISEVMSFKQSDMHSNQS